MKKHLDCFIPRLYLRHKNGPDFNLAPQSTICSYASVFQHSHVRNLATKSMKRKVGDNDFKWFESFIEESIHSLFHIFIFFNSTFFSSSFLIHTYIIYI